MAEIPQKLFQNLGGNVFDAGFNPFKRFSITLIVIFNKQVFRPGSFLGGQNFFEIDYPFTDTADIIFNHLKERWLIGAHVFEMKQLESTWIFFKHSDWILTGLASPKQIQFHGN